MNEQTVNLINQILKKSIEIAEKTGTFAVEQFPDIMQQLLLWKGVGSFLIWFFMGLFLTVANILFFIKIELPWLNGKGLDNEYYSNRWEYGPVISINIVLLFSSVMFLVYELTWLQILIAPKLYLLEYAATLIK